MTETDVRRPGRPRNAQADSAILDAALHLIAQEGVHGMSVDEVAARAGVSKTTIYRRWPNKDALVIEALTRFKPPLRSFDTGSLRSDIERFLTSLQVMLNEPLIQMLTLRILSEVVGRPEWSRVYFADSISPNFTALSDMIDRARARGELRADADTQLVMEIFSGPLVYHMLVAMFLTDVKPFDTKAFIDLVWDGLKPFRTDSSGASPENT
ncbi:MAG TPA: TetR/AcrR family transcriptional regulator [Ktedonobacterales bacterium]